MTANKLQANSATIENKWQLQKVMELFTLPFNDLLFKAAEIHRKNFNPNEVQVSTLLSIKTGSCPEDCKYCPQSAHYNTGLEKQNLMNIEEIVESAKEAKSLGATRFCMGAAWRSLNDRDMPQMTEIISQVKKLGIETCVTLGMANKDQLKQLKDSGLDYYNHNIDTSEEYYSNIITTRSFEDRLQTLQNVSQAGLNTCSGGIVGMGENLQDRANMLLTLANLPTPPKSVPINMLVKVAGTPLEDCDEIDGFDFVRTIAVARIMMPSSYVRLSAGRESMNDELQALCFLAGANSIFYGEKLLTTSNPSANDDIQLFARLGINQEPQNKESVKEYVV